jgi:type IV fimbrial biogenesis protein FimT
MLTLKLSRGLTLIELMVGLSIMAFLLLAGAPSLSTWIRNAQIRSAAESIMTGLHHARSEAVKRNSSTRFQLTSTLDNTCTVSSSGQNWVINMGSGTTPAGSCANKPSNTAPPLIVQKSVATNSSGITIAASPGSVVSFNGLGQQTSSTAPDTAIGTLTIDVSSSSGSCLSTNSAGTTGTYRCLRILVSPAGQARMCDPAMGITSNSNQPTAC